MSLAGRRPDPRIAWTIAIACKEFGINPKTLSGRLRQAGIDPDKEGRYTTKQIAGAIFGDLEFERTRETRAKANSQEMANAKSAGELVDMGEWSRRWAPVFVELVRIVRSSKLTEVEQVKILAELAKVIK